MRSLWVTETAPPLLQRGEVHLWRLPWRAAAEVSVQAVGAPWLGWLSAEERGRLALLRHPADRRRRGAGRGLTRLLLSHYCRVEAALLPLITTASGAVELGGPAGDGVEAVRFNLTYSAEWIVLAVTLGARVGVDIEHRVAEDVEPLVRQFFSAGEIAAWQALPAEQRGRGFYEGWTRKEAYLKALGVGLGRSPQSFSVSLNVEPPVVWLDDPQARDVRGGWWLGTGGVDARHSLAVVVEGMGPVAVRRCQLGGKLRPWS